MRFAKLKKLLALAVAFCLVASFIYGCGGTGGGTEAESETETEADTTEAAEKETVEMTIGDDETIALIALDEGDGSIYGKYLCESDGSVWAFGGNILAVAFDDENGEESAYICNLEFYQTAEPDEEGNYSLCVNIINVLENTSSCWYAGNIVDDEENIVGVMLINPSNEEETITLRAVEDESDTEESESE